MCLYISINHPTQLRDFHMVSPHVVFTLFIFLTMQSYKFYLSIILINYSVWSAFMLEKKRNCYFELTKSSWPGRQLFVKHKNRKKRVRVVWLFFSKSVVCTWISMQTFTRLKWAFVSQQNILYLPPLRHTAFAMWWKIPKLVLEYNQ